MGGATDYRNASEEAGWRSRRLGESELLATMDTQGSRQDYIFNSPGVKLSAVCIDALHRLDWGVSQELIGSILCEYLHGGFCPGSNEQQQLKELIQAAKDWYTRNSTQNRLQNISRAMFQRAGEPPQLRAKGGEAEAWPPLLWHVPSKCRLYKQMCIPCRC